MPEPDFPEDIATSLVDDHGAVVVVRMKGEIDMTTGASVGGPLFACLEETPRAVVIDLTEVGFFGAKGLNLLVEADQRALRDAIALRIVANTPAVLRPLEACGLDSHLPISHCLVEALSSIGAAEDVGTG